MANLAFLPTSQYRVGIGVPSSRTGPLRITTGPPDSSVSTTSNGPRGSRPKSPANALIVLWNCVGEMTGGSKVMPEF